MQRENNRLTKEEKRNIIFEAISEILIGSEYWYTPQLMPNLIINNNTDMKFNN